MALLRVLTLLSLVVWIGGIAFFAFVLAPTVFSVLPTRHLAGAVVTRSLTSLHWIGMVSAVVFLCSSMLHRYLAQGSAQPLAARHLLVMAMFVLTLFSQFYILRHMSELRSRMGEIDKVAVEDPLRVEFNRWHVWSTRVEGTVFLLGLAVVVLVAHRPL
jgi:hypothetical protein